MLISLVGRFPTHSSHSPYGESGQSRVAATGCRNSQQPRENNLQAKPDALLVR